MANEFQPGEHIMGSDAPQPAETNGYRLNHLMLRIKNPEKSLRFYKEGFGLRTVFVFNTGLWTIYYLGHPDLPEETGGDMFKTLGARKGLLELYHVPHDEQESYATGNEKDALGFGHMGFTVPDVAVAIERLKKVYPELEVLKGLGDDSFASMGIPPTRRGGEDNDVQAGYKAVFRQLAFVKDPDGYWVELVPEVVKP
ncbi:Glyoxalase/Bleomycin resistance protein/Dihydroxybiphenyl dioxygenase [Sphaerosporella brunnea]|uniref:Glyoxalase/Bleomycin resistance protein/Dihydroxybiphenyl dioxygenase n=1 Tax=Sphaerosporella brunnea TaxID=1250544 RepID=A0A5J5F7N7_9PEZI|nr:Glyoxalase/Bleomycin resistance protein/Dihydroxybiphenyl dioxygenase [Sphaerosporella brunnea]